MKEWQFYADRVMKSKHIIDLYYNLEDLAECKNRCLDKREDIEAWEKENFPNLPKFYPKPLHSYGLLSWDCCIAIVRNTGRTDGHYALVHK